MKNLITLCVITIGLISCAGSKKVGNDGWVSLFDGQSLSNWKVGENAPSFKVENGMIVVNGNTAHLFYALLKYAFPGKKGVVFFESIHYPNRYQIGAPYLLNQIYFRK